MVDNRASKKQQELLSFVDGFIKGNGYGPSYREIMRALGYRSVSTVAIHIDGLIAKGYLARRDKSARSLEVVTRDVVGKNPGAVAVPTEDEFEKTLVGIVQKAGLKQVERQGAAELFTRIGLQGVGDAVRAMDESTK